MLKKVLIGHNLNQIERTKDDVVVAASVYPLDMICNLHDFHKQTKCTSSQCCFKVVEISIPALPV